MLNGDECRRGVVEMFEGEAENLGENGGAVCLVWDLLGVRFGECSQGCCQAGNGELNGIIQGVGDGMEMLDDGGTGWACWRRGGSGGGRWCN